MVLAVSLIEALSISPSFDNVIKLQADLLKKVMYVRIPNLGKLMDMCMGLCGCFVFSI